LAINIKNNVSKTDENRRSVEFTISSNEMEKLFEKNLGEFRKQVSMKGFRPGQVPKQLFVSRFGDEVWRETVGNVVEHELKNEFEKMVETWKTDEKLEIAAPAEYGKLSAERGQDLVYKLSIAFNKPIVVQGYKDLGISVSATVVAEEEINDVIKEVRERFAKEYEVPPTDEEFYAIVGAKDEADLKSKVTDDVLRDKKYKARLAALKDAFDRLIEKNPFPVLEEQIKYTAERSLQHHHHGHHHHDHHHEEDEEEINVSEEQLNEMRPEITRAIQEDRILRSIVEQESLKPTQAQVDARVEEIANSAGMDFASVKDTMRKTGQINRIRESLKLELAQNLLIGETLPERQNETSTEKT
jgi:FKBP-type peptidyl-prolyl cis-trans isomerase (trigger factor)